MSGGDVPPDLRDFTPEALRERLAGLGLKPWRADQALDWLYKKRVAGIGMMTNLPRETREFLAAEHRLGALEPASRLESGDGAVKLGLRLRDGELVESVWMPEDGGATLCASAQVGCRMGCRFCRTGAGGFVRDLFPSEIVGQIFAAERELGKVSRIVLMGMGEPCDNLDNVLAAIDIMTHEKAMAISPRRVTLSTAGVRGTLARAAATGVNLAFSIHSAVAATRAAIVPGEKVFGLAEIREQILSLPPDSRRKLTIEAVLLGGLNDTEAEARAMAMWTRGMDAMVNLIPFNAFEGAPFSAPREAGVLRYQRALRSAGTMAFIRNSRGADILAACGQLRGGKTPAF